MINLLPSDTKENILYGRRNVALVRWIFVSLIVVIAMAATVLAGMFYINSSKNDLASSAKKTKDEITSQKLEQTQKQAVEISQGVKLIVQILSKEVRFSALLKQIGAIMPDKTGLATIQLSNQVTGGLDLTANAEDYQSATQVQINLSDPKNNLFEKVDTINVGCNDSSTNADGSTNRYPCQIVLRAKFKADAAVTFLASPTGAQK
jgi:Tfp pilus assembly protein PilN